jgi:hypothetical protein
MRWMAWSMLGLLVACGSPEPPPQQAEPSPAAGGELVVADDVGARLARFASVELDADLSPLSTEDRTVLGHLVRAAQQIDAVFLRQVWTGNPELRRRVAAYDGPRAESARAYFDVNYGPWDRLQELEPFIGTMPHPAGAGFYPLDLTADAFDRWLEEHPEDTAAFRSETTVIRRREDGGLEAIPYSTAYRAQLEPAAEELRRAAAATTNASLERFLELRAEAFGSDDYHDSDVAWMDLDSLVEPTIGPYEVYEDGLFGYKASFEAFLTVTLPEESEKLTGYKAQLPWLERNLPIPDEHKNLNRGTESPIRVVDLVLAAGEASAGVQTLAFNLPNDERVREAKGSKKVLLHNVLRAKFDTMMRPIADRVLAPDQAARVSFEAFMTQTLHHELSHGLGPGRITVDGRQTEVRLELGNLYSTIEEAKADVMGVYDILALIDKGVIPAELRASLEPTYLAGLFRAARFGLHEAHGQGVVAQFNYLAERGAVEVDGEGRYRVVSEAFPGAIRSLLHELLLLQATGDQEGTARFLDRYGRPDERLVAVIDQLEDVPSDIRPFYPQADTLAAAVEQD